MSNLFEQFQNHPLFQNLINKLDEIDKLLDIDSFDENQKESLLAYKQILTTININLRSKALPMVPKNVLDNLNAAIVNLSQTVLLNINSYPGQYTTLLDWYKRIPTLEKKSELKESFNSLIENFLSRQDKIEGRINAEIDNFQVKQEKQFENWENEKIKMQEEIDSLREQNNILKSQVEDFNTEIQEQQVKIDKMIATFQNTFNENTDDFEERFVNKETEYNDKIETLLSEQKNAADNTLAHLEKRKEEIEKLWGIIGKSATVGNASFVAEKHKEFADTMMWWTIGLMTIGLLFIGVATWKLFTGKYVYTDFVWKVITSAIILIPAFYCANISKRQRDREFQLRDFEIKTATLEPFMENMILDNVDATEQEINKDKVKLELTKAFFNHQFNLYDKNDDCVVLPKEMAKILNNLAKKCHLNVSIGDDKK